MLLFVSMCTVCIYIQICMHVSMCMCSIQVFVTVITSLAPPIPAEIYLPGPGFEFASPHTACVCVCVCDTSLLRLKGVEQYCIWRERLRHTGEIGLGFQTFSGLELYKCKCEADVQYELYYSLLFRRMFTRLFSNTLKVFSDQGL